MSSITSGLIIGVITVAFANLIFQGDPPLREKVLITILAILCYTLGFWTVR